MDKGYPSNVRNVTLEYTKVVQMYTPRSILQRNISNIRCDENRDIHPVSAFWAGPNIAFLGTFLCLHYYFSVLWVLVFCFIMQFIRNHFIVNLVRRNMPSAQRKRSIFGFLMLVIVPLVSLGGIFLVSLAFRSKLDQCKLQMRVEVRGLTKSIR